LYNAHILRRAIRRAELHVLQGEGHFFVVTSPRRTAEAIREFLCSRTAVKSPRRTA
jgi:pimeloyl-ACP methyl ester carboxylesterase